MEINQSLAIAMFLGIFLSTLFYIGYQADRHWRKQRELEFRLEYLEHKERLETKPQIVSKPKVEHKPTAREQIAQVGVVEYLKNNNSDL